MQSPAPKIKGAAAVSPRQPPAAFRFTGVAG